MLDEFLPVFEDGLTPLKLLAMQVLDGLRPTQWECYVNECLPRDRTVLDKLADESRPVENWWQVVSQHLQPANPAKDRFVADLIEASVKGAAGQVKQKAGHLRSRLRM
jgi:hypothetical protein